jgi:hypothetical protein
VKKSAQNRGKVFFFNLREIYPPFAAKTRGARLSSNLRRTVSENRQAHEGLSPPTRIDQSYFLLVKAWC